MIKVIHVRDMKPGDFYCGREASRPKEVSGIYAATALGNPYLMSEEEHRPNVIFRYKQWLIHQMESDGAVSKNIGYIVGELKEKKEVRLACFCAPKACHCDMIKEMIELNLE